MTSSGAALGLYLRINLLLMVSYLAFRLCQVLLSRFASRPGFASARRLGQALVLASVVMPFALAFAPPRKMPRLPLGLAQPFLDGATGMLGVTTDPRARPRLPGANGIRPAPPFDVTALFAEAKPTIVETVLLLLAAGIGWMALELSRKIRHLRHLIRGGALIRRIGRVAVLVSDSVSVPLSTRVDLQAVIVVPPSIVANAGDLRIAVRHELQHHRQGDTAWALWVELFVCLCFPNPAIYLWKRQIVELEELSCDEALIGRRGVRSQDYGDCLLRVAEIALRTRQVLVGAACMAASSGNSRYFKSFLRRRIEMFAEYRGARRTATGAITLGTLCALTLVAVAYGSQQALRPDAPVGPNPGRALFDPIVQSIAEKVLQGAVATDEAKGGFVLVSDPATGRLLAAANIAKDPPKQGGAWSLSYRLEPASAMKGLTAAFAVDRHATTFDEPFDCERGEYLYGRSSVHDWRPFDRLSTAEAVTHSSNICGIKVGERLGVAGLTKMLHEFGFGTGGTTQGFPEAAPGDVPSPTQLSKEAFVAAVADGAILDDRPRTGELATGDAPQPEFTVTPLEMVQAYGAIANEGKLMWPVVADSADSSVSVVRQVLDRSTADGMKAVLKKVVTDGTGQQARSAFYTTAGKTSTAYNPDAPESDNLDRARAVAGFVGFAPVDKPRVVIYVGIIEPRTGSDRQPYGGKYAAPVFREVAERVLQAMNVAPDQR